MAFRGRLGARVLLECWHPGIWGSGFRLKEPEACRDNGMVEKLGMKKPDLSCQNIHARMIGIIWLFRKTKPRVKKRIANILYLLINQSDLFFMPKLG
jgi:hypothetical protein